MNFIRVIAIALIIWIIIRLIKLALEKKKQSGSSNTIRLVNCSYCSTQIPENTAIHTTTGYFCSEEHQRLHQDS